MELTESQRVALDRVWSAFEERDVAYVVLHGYEDLPRSTAGSDVDFLVAEESFDEAVNYCRRAFEPDESLLRNAIGLAVMVTRSPRAVLYDVVASPGDATAAAKRRLVSSDVSGQGYVSRVFDAAGLKVHLVNHLTYESPMDGSRVRVDPGVEDATFEHRVQRGSFYSPAAPEELLHLVCRGVFDYGGDFPARYASRCDTLVDEVHSEPERVERFRDLLSLVFYGAETLVYTLVTDGEYDAIRSRLRRYSDY